MIRLFCLESVVARGQLAQYKWLVSVVVVYVVYRCVRAQATCGVTNLVLHGDAVSSV